MLNPVDHMLLATHEVLRHAGAAGLNVLLMLDVRGPLDAGELRRAVRAISESAPELSARLRLTPVLRRATLVVDPHANLAQAIDFEYLDGGDADMSLQRALNDRIDPASDPQFKLIHIALGSDRHRIGLRWAHHMTDVEGAMMLLGLIGAALRGEPLPRRAVAPASPAFAFSLGALWLTRWRYIWWSYYRQPRMVPIPEFARPEWNYSIRHLDAAARTRFQAAAKRRTAAGPAQYSRHFLGCFARTYWEICRERGRPRRHAFFSFVSPLPQTVHSRGLLGTNVTIPWIRLSAADLESSKSTHAAIDQFLLSDYSTKGAQGDWLAAAAMQHWPLALQSWFIRKRSPPGAACVTAFRFGESARRFGHAAVTDIAVVGTANCHPGWVTSYTTYGDRMTIGVGFRRDYLSPEDVNEFVARLDQRLCE